MDPSRAFFLTIRMETTLLAKGGTKGHDASFSFPLVVDCTSSFNDFRSTIYRKYPWGMHDAAEFRFWNVEKATWNPLQCDDELGVMFATYADSKTANVETTVIQRCRAEAATTAAKPPASKATNKTYAAGSTSRSRSAPPSSTCNPPVTPTANVPRQPGCKDTKIPLEPMIEEAEPDDVLGSDEEDERMFPDLVQKTNEEIDEDFIPAEFSDTDSEEEQENIDMGHFENDDEDRPEMMYDRENPSLAEGVVFPSAVDCRNAVATFSIQHEVEFKIEKSDPSRFTVYCAFSRCRWRLHASLMRNSTLFQVVTVLTN